MLAELTRLIILRCVTRKKTKVGNSVPFPTKAQLVICTLKYFVVNNKSEKKKQVYAGIKTITRLKQQYVGLHNVCYFANDELVLKHLTET